MTDHELQLKAVALRRAAVVASAILADVEPGFQPGGKNRRVSETVRHARARWQIVRSSGRQDAALYGRQGCPPPQLRRVMLRSVFASVLSVLSLVLVCVANADQPKPVFRPRVIISTDFPPTNVIPVKAFTNGITPPAQCSDPDDVQSMVRFLVYVNEFDVEGLIASAGSFANVANKTNILNMLDLYEQVYPNLVQHDAKFPTAAKLRSITWQGRDGAWGTPKVGTDAKQLEKILGEGKDTEASEAIIKAVDKPDPRPLWVCVWGGSREVAQAIWKLQKTRSPQELQAFLDKLRIYLVVKQDSTTDWLLENFPNLFVILTEKNYLGMFYQMFKSDPKLGDLAWIDANVRFGHGPLGAVYPTTSWDLKHQGTQEGDSPSFLYLVSAVRGLNDPEKPDQESWGGKFVRSEAKKNHWFDDPAGTQTVSKWRADVQKDFAERMNWCVTNNFK